MVALDRAVCLAPLGDAFVGFPEAAVEGGSLVQLSLVGGDVLADPAHVLVQLVAHPGHRLDQVAEHPSCLLARGRSQTVWDGGCICLLG